MLRAISESQRAKLIALEIPTLLVNVDDSSGLNSLDIEADSGIEDSLTYLLEQGLQRFFVCGEFRPSLYFFTASITKICEFL